MVSRDQIVSQAQVIFREVLESPDLILTDGLTALKVPGWDSLNHVTLVMTLEEQFKVKFTTREVMGWRNVGQMLDCLQAKLDTRGAS
jgi:acyl carrier protein